jgi:hypothetical protein
MKSYVWNLVMTRPCLVIMRKVRPSISAILKLPKPEHPM